MDAALNRDLSEQDLRILFNTRLLLYQVIGSGITVPGQPPVIRRAIRTLAECAEPDEKTCLSISVYTPDIGGSTGSSYEYIGVQLVPGEIQLSAGGYFLTDAFTSMTWSIGRSGTSSFVDWRHIHGVGSLSLLEIPDLGADGNGYTVMVG